MSKTILWLDDFRDPSLDKWSRFLNFGDDTNIVWVKSYSEFTDYISNNVLPYAICFDHDLGEDKSGYDCAKWLVEFCMDNDLQLPHYTIQSSNPVGKENIDKLLSNYNRHWREK